jgi:hypothetical protein
MEIQKGAGQSLILKLLSSSTLLISVLLSGVGLFLLIVAMQRRMLPYNSEGNYFDGEGNYHEQSITAYGLLAAVFFLGAAISFAIRLLVKRLLQSDRK